MSRNDNKCESNVKENLYSNSEEDDIDEDIINSDDEDTSKNDSYYCSNSSSTFEERRIMHGEKFSNWSNLQALQFDGIVQSSDLQPDEIIFLDPSNVLESTNEFDHINKTIMFGSIKNISEKTVNDPNVLKINKVYYQNNDDSNIFETKGTSTETTVIGK